MRQTGHVVVINGVNDGLHHKGVFLILEEWRLLPWDSSPFCCSQDDLILWILFITCPLKSLFHLSSCINIQRSSCGSKHTELFYSVCAKWPADLHLDSSELSYDALLHRDVEETGREVRREGGLGGQQARVMWGLFIQAWHCSYIPPHHPPAGGATTESPLSAAKRLLGIFCQPSCFGGFSILKLLLMRQDEVGFLIHSYLSKCIHLEKQAETIA